MDKLITTHNGGMPDTLDHFRWYEESVKNVLENICRGLNNGASTALVLWGVNVTISGNNYDVTEGAIFVQGEIFRVPAHTLARFASGTGTYYWDLDVSYNPEGFLTFESNEMHDVYKIRVMKLYKTTDNMPAGSFVPLALPKLSDVWTLKGLYTAFKNEFDQFIKWEWQNITLNNQTVSTQAGVLSNNAIIYLKFRLNGKTLDLQWDIVIPNTPNPTTASIFFFNLPSSITSLFFVVGHYGTVSAGDLSVDYRALGQSRTTSTNSASRIIVCQFLQSIEFPSTEIRIRGSIVTQLWDGQINQLFIP
ncbi:MAG: hypothetical protein H0X62_16260 [Bacteroidetes bacterium]|jgi:hypothetical protein|nr:hypothetical protein [Bacteroidota bacterium]